MKALLLAFLLMGGAAHAQVQLTASVTTAQSSKGEEELKAKAAEWIASLQLNDAAREARVTDAVYNHLKLVRAWHNEHPPATVPAGINPLSGSKLTDLERQIIATSAQPKEYHDNLMAALRSDLTPEGVEAVLDKYTIGKVAFTLQGYKAIVPDLTAEEEAKITAYLKQAREQAIDYKNMKEISAIFEIYKTKCEQFLNNNGRNWRQLYKAYTDKVKAEKAAKQAARS